MGKSNKQKQTEQTDLRPTYRARWEMKFEDDREKRKRPKSTRFILEDENEEDTNDYPQEADELLYPEEE